MKTFEELECWKKAASLRRKLSILVRRLPKEEKYRMADQIIRASRSVTSNIAEGYGRFHYQEYAQFCRQSRGPLFEVLDHLITAFDEEYIKEEELNEIRSEIENCLAVLNGFINYLLRAKAANNQMKEPNLGYSGATND